MWIKTTERVCVEIRKQHKEELAVYASYTDVDGCGYEWSSGSPEIMTEWGFKKAETPLYKVLMTKESVHDKDWQYEYFLYCPTKRICKNTKTKIITKDMERLLDALDNATNVRSIIYSKDIKKWIVIYKEGYPDLIESESLIEFLENA